MGMELGISVIVPIYNAALYLDECISSILNQSFSSFELICVDDGSRDDSLVILNSYAERDSRIKIIQQKNQGAGVARNTGLRHAAGKYILFLDADDFFEQDMFLNLFRTAEAKDADIVVCNADEYDTATSTYYSSTLIYDCPGIGACFSASDVEEYIFNFTAPAPWNKFFRREYIIEQGLLFQNLKSTNDLFFVYSALVCCSRIAVLDEVLVHYRINNKYSLQGSRNKDTLDAFRALSGLRDFLISRDMFEVYSNSFNKLVGSVGIYTLANIPPDRFKNDVMSCELHNFFLLLIGKKGNKVDFNKDKIVIYGAGQMAVVFIRCLVELLGVDKKNIGVVVSSLSGNKRNICDLPVVEIHQCGFQPECTMVICSSVASSRQDMMNNAHNLGYKNIILFDDVAVLRFCYALCCNS